MLAGSLIGYALRLAETGRPDEALTANNEAVARLRTLAAERPLAYGVQLATALSNRSGRHADLDQLHPALADSTEAVALWRTLTATVPDAAAPGMPTP